VICNHFYSLEADEGRGRRNKPRVRMEVTGCEECSNYKFYYCCCCHCCWNIFYVSFNDSHSKNMCGLKHKDSNETVIYRITAHLNTRFQQYGYCVHACGSCHLVIANDWFLRVRIIIPARVAWWLEYTQVWTGYPCEGCF
jgi:hypothetical protein